MCGLAELGIADGVAMTLFDTRHLVIGNGMKLVICDRGRLGLEFVKVYRDIAVIKLLRVDGIGGVVDQHIRVNPHIHEVYDIVVDYRGLVRHPVEP